MKKVLVFIIINIILFTIIYYTQVHILQRQNFYNVEAAKNIFKKNNVKTEKNIVKYAKCCLKYTRNFGKLGDMFIVDPKTLRVIWDASSDCKLDPSKSFLKKGYICNLFYDKESCIKVSNLFKKTNEGCTSWNFYSYPEYLYYDVYKLNDPKLEKVLIVSGGEYPDILSVFIPLILFILIVNVIIFISFKSKQDE